MAFCGSESVESKESEDDLMVLSVETQSMDRDTGAIRLACQIGGHEVLFLLDSFLSERLAQGFPNKIPLPKEQRVRIAGGGYLSCTDMVQQ